MRTRGFVYDGERWRDAPLAPSGAPVPSVFIVGIGRLDGRRYIGPTYDLMLYFAGAEPPKMDEVFDLLRSAS